MRLKRLLIFLGLPIILIGGLLWALPELIRLSAEHWLQEQNLQAEIEDIDLNLFTGKAAIRGVRISNTHKRGLRLESLSVDLRHRPLLKKRIHLSELQLTGLNLDVARNLEDRQGLEVAGIQLPASEQESQKSDESGWGFGLDKTHIDTSTITYSDPLLQQSITLQASSMSDLATWVPGQPIQINSVAQLAGGELSLQGHIQPFGQHISSELDVQAEGLPLASAAPFIPDEDIRVDGFLHADIRVKFDYKAESGIDLKLSGDSRLSKYQLGLAQPALDIGGKLLQWQGDLELALPNDKPLSIKGSGKVATKQLEVLARRNQSQLLNLESLNIAQLKLDSLTNATLTGIELSDGSSLSQPKGSEDQAALISWQAAKLQSLNYKNGNLGLGPVAIVGIDSQLERDAQGQWNIEQAIAQALGGQTKEPVTTETSGNEPADSPQTGNAGEPAEVVVNGETVETAADNVQQPQLQLAELNISDSRLNFIDNTVNPALTMQLQALNLQLGALDNSQPQLPSPVQINSKVGDYGKLDLKGNIKPFATPPAASLKGKITGIDTVPLSGFTRKLVGHRIKQGTVSGDLNININEGRLDSSVNLVLNKLQIAAIQGQAGEFEKNSGMPLGTALSLLRDRDENIRLDIPITGALGNPDVNINDIIRQAIFKGVSTAALAFYSPLGVITVGDKLLQLATALRFDPIVFAPGQTELDATAITHLAKLTDVLIQRPALQISLCGIATPADRQMLAEEIATENTRLFGLVRPDPEPEAVPDERLLKLARQRMRAVGDYLNNNGVDPGRFILCDGEISDQAKAKPGVRIEL